MCSSRLRPASVGAQQSSGGEAVTTHACLCFHTARGERHHAASAAPVQGDVRAPNTSFVPVVSYPFVCSPPPDATTLLPHSVFDMDGTLTLSNIAFDEMRTRTGIPYGDLFTVMEGWQRPDRIRAAFDVIHELEARALSTLQLAPGLEQLLQQLLDDGLEMAIVTRNTPTAVDALFRLLGEHWRPRFSVILTRHFQYVKPDRRLLLHVAETWKVEPSELLMVGDSREDVEIGNICGAASCLIAGGGNEPFAMGSDGFVPTISVTSLHELAARLRPATDADAALLAPPPLLPPGISFLEFLLDQRVVNGASCSYPSMGYAVGGGLVGCADVDERVLHIDCGDGFLTKCLHSHGIRAVGVDMDAAALDVAHRRGLEVRRLESLASPGSLGPAGTLDAVLLCTSSQAHASLLFQATGALKPGACEELHRALKPGGRLACQWSDHPRAVAFAQALAQYAQQGKLFEVSHLASKDAGSATVVLAKV